MSKKQIFVNIIAQSIAFVCNAMVSFFLTPVIIKNIGDEAYGFWGLANNIVSYAQVITIAINSMAGRFITIAIQKKVKEDINQYFSSVILANIFMTLTLLIPSCFIIVKLNNIFKVPDTILFDVKLLWIFVFLNFFISLITSVYCVATFATNRLEFSSISSIVGNLIKVATLVFSFALFTPKIWYLGLATIMSTLTFLAANIYITKKLLPEIKFKTRYFSLIKIKELFFSGIWNSFNRLSSIFSTGLDLVIANLFVSSAAMGSLYLSKTIPGLVLSVFAMIATSFAPQFTISYARNEMDAVKDQLIFSMKILGMIASIPVAILFIFGDVFYSLWIPGEDIKLIYLLSIVSCIEYVFVLPLEGLWNIFTVTNKVKQSSLYLFINSVIVILIVFMLMHVLRSDILKLFVIAGVSTIFSIIRGLLFLPIYGAKCLGMKWNTFYPMIFKSTLSTILLFCISGIIKSIFYSISWVALVIYCILIVLISLCINAVVVLDREDRKKVITTVIKIIRKRREIYE